jgi:protein-tyrosine phosphatase
MVSPVDPAGWWRYPCFAHERLIVTGDLPSDPEAAGAQLAEWRRLGVTHIVDVREEWSDASFVATVAPEITYVAAGCDDMGNRRSDEWFESVLDGLGDALSEPDAVVLVHCHMGVNRAPSMAVRLMLEQGWDAVDAVEAIRTARPIAALVYAQDAVDHYHREHGSSDTERFRDRRRVRDWLAANPVDVGWVITKIRRAEGDAR